MIRYACFNLPIVSRQFSSARCCAQKSNGKTLDISLFNTAAGFNVENPPEYVKKFREGYAFSENHDFSKAKRMYEEALAKAIGEGANVDQIHLLQIRLEDADRKMGIQQKLKNIEWFQENITRRLKFLPLFGAGYCAYKNSRV